MKEFVIIVLLTWTTFLTGQVQRDEVDINSFEVWELVDLGLISIETFYALRDFIKETGQIRSYYELCRIGISHDEIRELMNFTFIGSNNLSGRSSVYYDSVIENRFRVQGDAFSFQSRFKDLSGQFFFRAKIKNGEIFSGSLQNQMQEFTLMSQNDLFVFPNWEAKKKSIGVSQRFKNHQVFLTYTENDYAPLLVHNILFKDIALKSKFTIENKVLQHRNYLSLMLRNVLFKVELRGKDGFLSYKRFTVLNRFNSGHMISLEKTSELGLSQIRLKAYLKFHRLNIVSEWRRLRTLEYLKNNFRLSVYHRLERYSYRLNTESNQDYFKLRFQGNLLLDEGLELRHQFYFKESEHSQIVFGGGIQRSSNGVLWGIYSYKSFGLLSEAAGFYTEGFSRRSNMIYLSRFDQLTRVIIGGESNSTIAKVIIDLEFLQAEQKTRPSFKIELSRLF